MDKLTRRTMMAASAAALAGMWPRPSSAAGRGNSLHKLAQAKGMRFGSTIGAGGPQSGSFRNADYVALLKHDCGILVAENEMKWQALRPTPDRFAFEKFDQMIAFAKANRMAMRGHTLLWHRPQWMPAWLENHNFGGQPASEAERILTTHIRTVTNRYRDKILSYDVVNETVLEDASLAQTALSRAMGGTEALVDMAFRTTRAQLPDAQLVYNDYMSWEPGNEKHREGVLRLLEGFRKRNVPVDALGLQSHIRIDRLEAGRAPRQAREWRDFLDAVVAMGYDLLITEFDVNDQVLPAAITTRDADVAAYTRDYLDITLSYRQLKDFLLWGMSDAHSWLQSFQPLRADGLAKRPSPYDVAGRPKPLRDAIASALRSAPAR